ncbi:MAG: hypothetical protein WDO71_27080 [Bacteroidota bacterium]
MGTETLEELRIRFPEYPKMDEVLFNLYYCYNKNGETAKAGAIKKLMDEKFKTSNFTTIVTTGKDPQSKTATGNEDATKTYEKIYDLFIEGNLKKRLRKRKLPTVLIPPISGRRNCCISNRCIISNKDRIVPPK